MVRIEKIALLVYTTVVALFTSNPVHAKEYPYGEEFSGDATYYGYTTRGNCAIREPIPSMYGGMIPVALNAPQVQWMRPSGSAQRSPAEHNA